MVHWMLVGFVHGVMDTDNMSILGLTIDYGPYGCLEGFDPTWTPNTTDAGGRRLRGQAQTLRGVAQRFRPDPLHTEAGRFFTTTGAQTSWLGPAADTS